MTDQVSFVPVIEGRTTCPSCNHNFEVSQHHSEGAHYSKNQKHFTPKQTIIISYIRSSSKYQNDFFTIDDLYSDYADDFRFLPESIMKKSSFQGRISELKGMGVLEFTNETPEKYKLIDSMVLRFLK